MGQSPESDNRRIIGNINNSRTWQPPSDGPNLLDEFRDDEAVVKPTETKGWGEIMTDIEKSEQTQSRETEEETKK